MSRTLTFGDDGSNAADTCWGWINAQHWEGWTVDVVTAEDSIVPVPQAESEPHPWSSPHPREADEAAAIAEVRHLVAKADPRLALSHPTDLLAVGPRGPGLLKALHLGSTADWLVQQPPAPLVIARTATRVRKVLIAHDGSVHAAAATDAFASLPWAADCAVTVVVVDDGRTQVEPTVAAATARLAEAGITPEILILEGRPTPALTGAIEDLSPDLVVMGTRGHTGIQMLRVGSSAASVLRLAPSSILIAAVND